VASIAIDTNVLVYAEGVERTEADAAKIAISRLLTRGLLEARIKPVIAVQALAELHSVLVTRRRLSARNASALVRDWIERAEIVASDQTSMTSALDLAADHGLQIFDALIFAAAAKAGCDILLSEDMQDGFAWRGVVVTNPFGPSPHPRLARLLG
jgi:predicted nucleic acid-binding protein